MRNKAGFTLIELMIVIVIIAIIAAISIPNLMRSRMTANELAAVESVRTLSSAEIEFQGAALVTDGQGTGMFGTLGDLSGANPPFIDSVLGGGTKQGYLFQVDLSNQAPGIPAFGATATPISPGFGTRAFYVDDTGLITFTNDGTVPDPNSNPVQ